MTYPMLGSPQTFARRLLRWYDAARRDLPWCAVGSDGRPNPYHVLVSEAMLQQTQVATVIPYFNRFIARFGSFRALAAADEQDVLRMWQGLGYYSRARNLRAAARKVVSDFAGELPRDVEGLMRLPGVGRYTAGAIASIAFGRRAPILDGNVIRVLCRLDRITTDPREKGTQTVLWSRAEAILPKSRLGDFNSALMELGALVCTPRSPQCLICPVREHCEAFRAGVQEQIPAPRKAKETPLLERKVFCIERAGRWLIEQRPAKGRWAGMWQFVTVDAVVDGTALTDLPCRVSSPRPLGEVSHGLTHRRYRFQVFACTAAPKRRAGQDGTRKWVTLDELDGYPLPRPHLKIMGILRSEKGRA
jgi:A/G-specific adenine glycosylase